MTSRPKIAFISGPIEPGWDYFTTHYAPRIREAVAAGHSFVIGPAPGMDTLAFQFLMREGVDPSRVTVYFAEFQEWVMASLKEHRENLGAKTVVEGLTTADRDGVMTRDSDYDILRYMDTEEQKAFYGARYYPRVSNTENNERRRLGARLPVNTTPSPKK